MDEMYTSMITMYILDTYHYKVPLCNKMVSNENFDVRYLFPTCELPRIGGGITQNGCLMVEICSTASWLHFSQLPLYTVFRKKYVAYFSVKK